MKYHEISGFGKDLLEEEIERLAATAEQLEMQTITAELLEAELRNMLGGIRTALRLPTPSPQPQTYDFALHLLACPTPPLYVRQSFDISLKLVVSGNISTAAFPLQCRLSVRKMDVEKNEVKATRLGKPFLNGDLTQPCVQGQDIYFKELHFTDVSSIYPLGRVNLLFDCPDCPCVKQLLIEGVRVKSRKRRADEVI